jgi:hypothetical protein
MNNLMRILILVGAVSSSKALAVGFHCYSMPNTAVQTYEYASGNCGGAPTDKMARTIEMDGDKDVLCMISTGCEVVSDDMAKLPPPDREQHELMSMYNNGTLKTAILLCRGKAPYRNGLIAGPPRCPEPKDCHKDVFYNFSAMAASPWFPQGTNVVKPEDAKGIK